MTFEIRDPVAWFRGQSEYWRRVNETEGFDLEGIKAPKGTTGLMPYYCEDKFQTGCPNMVDLYAKVGLHRYNMLEGTKLQLSRVIKFNNLMNMLSSYYITLVASDPVSGSQQPFQVRVDEDKHNCLGLTVSVARPKDVSVRSTAASTMETPLFSTTEILPLPSTLEMPPLPFSPLENPPLLPFSTMEEELPFFTMPLPSFTMPRRPPLPSLATMELNDQLPEWPSVDAFISKRFYLFEESELRDMNWIGLYLQIQVCKFDHVDKANLSKLKILKVAIESMNEDVEPRNAKSAIVYITFKGLAIRGMSEHLERKAIIRRVVNERTGCLSLLGGFSGEERKSSTMNVFESFEFVQSVLSGITSI